MRNNYINLLMKSINEIYKLLLIFLFIIFYILSNKYIIYNLINCKNKLQSRLNFSNIFSNIYSDLYFLAKSGKALKPVKNLNYKEKIFNINYKGICLCTICKNENLYLREYVEYYRLLGFDKIIIFDNNDINGETFNELLKYYILNDFVEIIDIRGLKSVQIGAYNYCYEKSKNKYDWIAFFDLDEYLYIKNNLNITNYLYNKRFQKCQSIVLNWHIFDDNDLVKYDNRTLLERFKRIKFKSSRAKSIIRGSQNNILISSVHILAINIQYFCNSRGNRIFPNSFLDIKYNNNNLAYNII